MKSITIPEGYNTVMPYLIIEKAQAFIDFIKSVFDAEEKAKIMHDEKTIMHAEIKIGESVIMLAEATAQYKEQTAGLFIYVNDCDVVFKKALDNSATIIMEPNNQNYGRSAGVKDPFGVTWWITSA